MLHTCDNKRLLISLLPLPVIQFNNGFLFFFFFLSVNIGHMCCSYTNKTGRKQQKTVNFIISFSTRANNGNNLYNNYVLHVTHCTTHKNTIHFSFLFFFFISLQPKRDCLLPFFTITMFSFLHASKI